MLKVMSIPKVSLKRYPFYAECISKCRHLLVWDFKHNPGIDMRIKIKYFGILQEMSGHSEEVLDINDNPDTEDLLNMLKTKYPKLAGANFTLAINQILENSTVELMDRDEVALLPPFSGG